MTSLISFPAIEPASGAQDLHAVIPEHLCVGSTADPFLYGGSAFAVCIAAMERIADRPATLAMVQFVSKGRSGETISFAEELCSGGNSIRQVRMAAQISGKPFAYLQGAAGQRVDATRHQGSRAPSVPLPEQCPEKSVARLLSSRLNSLLEFRLAFGQIPDSRDWSGESGLDVAYWIRLRSGQRVQRLDLPVIADCAALALPSALGRQASGSSLDNMIRFAAEPDEEWVLASIRLASLQRGVAHVDTQLYSVAGTLLAIASQSMLLRERPPA